MKTKLVFKYINLGFPCYCLCLVFFVCATSCNNERVENSAAPDPPNILFIAVDDLNDWIGCLQGHPQALTPNIDRLAAKGTLFTNAHAQSPLCNPSRTSVLTGYRPSSTGIYGLSPWIRDVDSLKHFITLPQYFSKNGYTTYGGGKVFHGGYGRQATDREFDSVGPGAGVKVHPPTKLVGETPGGNNPWVDWGPFSLRPQDLQDYDVASWAVNVLKNTNENPYFLAVGFFLPHVPLYAPDSFFAQFPRNTLKMPITNFHDREDTPRASWFNHWDVPEPRWKWFREHNQDTLFVQSYLAAISFMDSQLGRVLDALEERPDHKRTIVVLWSDHGFHLGEKGISGKNTLWEESTRVPLIFVGPGIERGRVDSPAELLDIYPTLLELCGLPVKQDLEGHSLVPQLRRSGLKRFWPAITTNNYNNHSVRTQNWRYVRYADGSEELYDHSVDSLEWNNLIGTKACDFWKDSLRQWIPEVNKKPYVGDYQRILELKDGTPYWQGTRIPEDAPIPGL